MKPILTTMLAALAATCTYANPIDQRKAESIASQYLVPGHSINLVKKAVRSKLHKTSADMEKTSPYYIFSRGYDQGYVIVAGDDCLPTILGYTESGNYDDSNLPPALQDMLETWQHMVENAQASETNVPLAANLSPALTATRQNIAPLTTSHWHQTGPYNDLCPQRDDNGAKSMTGCVATAISQILYYWRKDLPATLQATTPTYGMDGYSHASVTLSIPRGTPLKWELMLDSYNGTPADYNEVVATMVYAVGTASHLEYAIEDGTATSGHIEDIPKAISTYFGMNGGWVAYRSSYTQEAWTQLIYNELAKGRPVMYTGVHPSSGGHAVYIDGYQKTNDLMHFNFGWGGQSDGYYTTTLETGMNGFNDYQSCLINAYPKKWNVKTTINLPPHTYANVDNEFKVSFENNSTLDFSGLYCFISDNTAKPASLSAAKSFDDATVFATDSKGELTFTAKPTSVKTWYVTITDRDLNVLAQKAVAVEKADIRLTLDKLEVMGTSESEEIAGNVFTKIYNSKAMVNAYVKNHAPISFGGTAKINLYASSDNGASFEFVKSIGKYNVALPANGDGCVSFSVTDLAADKLYYAEVEPEWGSSNNKTEVENTAGARGYFMYAGPSDLVSSLKDGVLSFSGHWDASLYSTTVASPASRSALAYDLTKVESVGALPQIDYPSANALIYANASVEGTNVVVGSKATGDMKIKAGYDFLPFTDITLCRGAQFDINQTPARWYLTTVPFPVDVPYGILAREVSGHATTASGINGKTTNVTRLEAGKSYLIMASSNQRQTLASPSSGLLLLAAPAENGDSAFVGTYKATEVPQGAKIVKDKEADKQYFMNAGSEVVEALRGYFYDKKMVTSTSDFRAFSNITLDAAYLELAKRIQKLYDVQQEMGNMVSDLGRQAMTDTIANAEKIFSTQSITSSTLVKKYYTELESWISTYRTMVGNIGDAELDMTSLITNPSFEASSTATSGWTSEKTGDAIIRQNSNLTYKTIHGEGKNYLYSKTGAAVTQSLKLAPGFYRLTAMVGCEDEHTVTLFAGNQELSVTAHPYGKHYLSEARMEDVLVDESGELTIGVKGSSWFNADDFHLSFTANSVTDAIVEIVHKPSSPDVREGIYTLHGVRVDKPTSPGIYIVNGKKTVVEF